MLGRSDIQNIVLSRATCMIDDIIGFRRINDDVIDNVIKITYKLTILPPWIVSFWSDKPCCKFNSFTLLFPSTNR